MNRRQLLKRGAMSAGVLIATPTLLLQTACGSTKQLVKWTTVLIGVLRDVSPILTDIGAPNIVALIAKALPIAERLKKAFEDNDNVATLDLLDNLINPQTGVIVEIANAVGALANDGRKKLVLGLLAIGQVALHLIAAQIQNDVPATAVSGARRARPRATNAVERAANSKALENAFNGTKF